MRILDNRIRNSDNDIFPSSDFGLFYVLSLIIYGLASHRDIHGKPPTQNSLQ